ncbi:MAG: rod shape-determining protein MreD [Thiobacillaceae bacterium]|nr:rod shape-determining protein MreD [Thiobacillaceae bacterium]MCX7674027.1 rod shape-determining protein MreD [Thiobacillaceae bacterium]MDW8324076.1 rod shape-determining protein MreD [Burkholderiales bacterium]
MNLDNVLSPRGPQLIAPAGARMVYGSLAVAFLLGLLPWPAGWRWLVPDFTFVVMLYWNIHSPHRAGVGLACGLGLLTDMAYGTLLGLNGLLYVFAAFAALSVRRRLENFAPPGQALQLAPIFLGKELALLLLGLAVGQAAVDWWYLAAGPVAALLWLPTCLLLHRLAGRPAAAPAATAPQPQR